MSISMDNVSEAYRGPSMKKLMPHQMDDWEFHVRLHMDARGCADGYTGKVPKLSRVEIRNSQTPAIRPARGRVDTDATRTLKKAQETALAKWLQQDRKAYAFIVQACEDNETAMELILAEENRDLSARLLMKALRLKFSNKNRIGVVQSTLAAFNSLELAGNEDAEIFVNRILKGRRELHGLGQKYIDLDVHCLGRLKESLTKDPRFTVVATTMRANPLMTWEEALQAHLLSALHPGAQRHRRAQQQSGLGVSVCNVAGLLSTCHDVGVCSSVCYNHCEFSTHYYLQGPHDTVSGQVWCPPGRLTLQNLWLHRLRPCGSYSEGFHLR